jgi:hypothetical protein
MARLPKFPKGLKSRLAKEERKAIQKGKIVSRKREIDSAKKKLEALRKKNRGY